MNECNMCDCCFLSVIGAWCCGYGCLVRKGLKEEAEERRRGGGTGVRSAWSGDGT